MIILNYTLYDNGVDSLKAAQRNLDEYHDNGENGEHFLKDSIIFLNHGVEIMLKYLISQKSMALLFADINKYLDAKEKMDDKVHRDVFDVNPQLRTITLEECIKRTEYACDNKIPQLFKATIFYVLKYRNKIMHFGLQLDPDEINELVQKLSICYEESIKFFSINIPNFDQRLKESRYIIKDIGLLEKQYNILIEEMNEAAAYEAYQAQEDYYADMYDALESYAIKSGK